MVEGETGDAGGAARATAAHAAAAAPTPLTNCRRDGRRLCDITPAYHLDRPARQAASFSGGPFRAGKSVLRVPKEFSRGVNSFPRRNKSVAHALEPQRLAVDGRKKCNAGAPPPHPRGFIALTAKERRPQTSAKDAALPYRHRRSARVAFQKSGLLRGGAGSSLSQNAGRHHGKIPGVRGRSPCNLLAVENVLDAACRPSRYFDTTTSTASGFGSTEFG